MRAQPPGADNQGEELNQFGACHAEALEAPQGRRDSAGRVLALKTCSTPTCQLADNGAVKSRIYASGARCEVLAMGR